ncbi:MAG: endonuclease/exonuclease/phosphatase family protein [Syntrophales bacterium]
MFLRSMNNAGTRWRVLGSILLVLVILLSWSLSPAWADSDKRIVKVMTRNMDAGTDLLYFFFYPLDFALAETLKEISANDFPGRAVLIADEIASEQPYLISLQEVTLWQYILPVYGPTDLADQLDLLVAALAARNLHYKVIASQDLTDITVPLPTGEFFRFLDRNVVLARSDLKQSELALSNIQMGIYEASIQPIPTLPFVQSNGWISVDAKIRGKSIRFFSTHLESVIDPTDITQLLQARELIEIMNQCKLPVVLAGDFNSDAEHTGKWTDQTPTADWIVSAGYQDVWSATHPGNPGLTWPLYFEDFLAIHPVAPLERIDLIFARDLTILDAHLTGITYPYGSDHAGVVSTLRIDK